MNSRTPLPLPAADPAAPAASPLTAHSPIGQRLASALESRLRRRRAHLDRLELALVHTIAAGTGWTTDWRVRARVDDRQGRAAHAPATAMAGLRTIDHGELPAGRALDQLWRWVLDTSQLHRLLAPLISERVVFCDAAAMATVEVIRHRVLRSAAVLDRLPVSLEVRLGRRREPASEASGLPHADAPVQASEPAASPAATTPVVRLVACFPAREGAAGDTCVVVWDSARRPELVALLRECARRFDPRSAAQAAQDAQPVPLSAPWDRR